MKPPEMKAALDYLGLTQAEAADLLGSTRRSISRWLASTAPSDVGCALKAWGDLKRAGLPWRPGSIPLADLPQVAEIIKRVATRGGASAPWAVDIERERALLGPITMTFRITSIGGARAFRPVSYDRSDAKPNLERDLPLLEDGIARIMAALDRTTTTTQAA
jgi:hypothetical protein